MEQRKRHCWECLRRSLVCDFTQPECKRCIKSGTPCPGYGEKEPLRLNWLAPGKVKSRTRARKTKDSGHGCKEPVITINDRAKNPDFLIIPRGCFKVNADAIFDAVDYYNSAMHPVLVGNVVGNHPFVYKIQPAHIHAGVARPDYLRLEIVCMALNHRIHSSKDPAYAQSLAPTYYHFRGLILRSLNAAMANEKTRKKYINFLMAGILSLLLADAHQGISLHWRFHLQGIQQLIALRGGLRALAGPGVEPLLLCYAYVTVLGDTSSPAHDLTMSTTLLAELDAILDDYGDKPYTFYPFPISLFAATVRINHLRARATALRPILPPTSDLKTEATEVLTTIQSFNPTTYAASRPPKSRPDWILLAQTIQSAVTIYCISSLQSVEILPYSPPLQSCKTTARQTLHTLLSKSLPTARFGTSVLWALVVLGVDAVHDSPSMRAFVSESLGPLSRAQGSYVPRMAREFLERFWASGRTDWDGCFDRPYALAMQWTVSRHGLR
ncbi:Zn(II)2Cys6 transcription factor [Aspergillus puulaauensis]|uniref:Zn(2)-C6 fungal-type domain-containing protein n=1 Tax=Aspergillus puulaauensis TaxID=1220207 RepID=A0A7R7XHL2_9EURO|nr:uncharacterized protein APUU_21897A [Aspergillus puulaauensis]BCS21465.1 hypothetical protein APUU_21897A [Aspergillus puulaauensis]